MCPPHNCCCCELYRGVRIWTSAFMLLSVLGVMWCLATATWLAKYAEVCALSSEDKEIWLGDGRWYDGNAEMLGGVASNFWAVCEVVGEVHGDDGSSSSTVRYELRPYELASAAGSPAVCGPERGQVAGTLA